ncbi:FHA domain-containing protein [Pseudoalteromonas denitrificans]|uniref:FHA domain protein n=1 Tax=Pseudoalteromonas denitrificans DSM 6059 TaxID=1123010 RepID=A0A1I1S3A5_9GAMM|nr:FHA domain-containing protein [Pseudoalteromonas denitrificans]SFD41015.1 FHA domain protein [Pseudoalteromonas denitrificans DSM 6059]
MAYLIEEGTKKALYLYAHHSFGRFIYSVDTLISNPAISKIHMTIEWQNNKWLLRDLSRNGTWVNDTRLDKKKTRILKLGDCITLSPDKSNNYIVQDLSAPCDLLIPDNDDGVTDAIELKPYHLLPCEEVPEIAMIFNKNENCWSIEYINKDDSSSFRLNEHENVEFNGQKWKLKLSHLENDTEAHNTEEFSIDDLELIFDISLDEETTCLKLTSPKGLIDFKTYIHHYLTLHLARCKAKDIKTNINHDMLGWINTETLCKDLGLDIYHLNIQIHRIRKQFSELLSDLLISDNIIERRKKHVRFTGSAFEIYKGKQLESAINNNQLTCHN